MPRKDQILVCMHTLFITTNKEGHENGIKNTRNFNMELEKYSIKFP